MAPTMSNAQTHETLDSLQLAPGRPTVVTIGTFDGVHRGHRLLLDKAIARARSLGGVAIALTFRNHPREVLNPGTTVSLLTPWPEKRRLLAASGIDVVLGLEFNHQFAAQSAEDFVDRVLLDRLQAAVVISGPNFRFGRGAAGDPALLQRLSESLDFEYWCATAVEEHGHTVSSSRIRQALSSGEVTTAAHMLGRWHRTTGRVVTGDQLGRKIGFPTANLEIPASVLVPAHGVYAVVVELATGARHPGMMNIGRRPTVGGIDERREVHLIGFSGELVGEELAVDFVSRLREEKRFASLDDLCAQLTNDRIAALEIVRSHAGPL